MNTSKLTSAIVTLSLVFFMSITSIANSSIFYSGGLAKSGEKIIYVTNTSEKDLSYLRFDVNNFLNGTDAEAIELPLANEFKYLRFDVDNFSENNTDNMVELPVNEFNNLRFDVNNFIESNTDSNIELPVNEFDYLRFDVNKLSSAGNNATDELPVTE